MVNPRENAENNLFEMRRRWALRRCPVLFHLDRSDRMVTRRRRRRRCARGLRGEGAKRRRKNMMIAAIVLCRELFRRDLLDRMGMKLPRPLLDNLLKNYLKDHFPELFRQDRSDLMDMKLPRLRRQRRHHRG